MKLKYIRLDITVIILGIILVFLSGKDVIPSAIATFYLILASFYFFPLKLVKGKRETFQILSDVLICITLIVAILLTYKEIKFLGASFGILNFAYIIYLAFFILNKRKDLGNDYRLMILLHFLAPLILIN
ncbi:hypothetical protein [Winogradskyella sp. 3972H.M.0a.05]|uniref:hypothetical protein n=1 Tax=Winogradskyella sp. 3972H.M.0a.05 TaxID=2950277 RepID=UPI003394A0A3